MDTSYLSTARDVYKEAALKPQPGLCCTTTPIWQLPGLVIPKKMLAMNYGCGSTVHPRDLVDSPTILYVGVGGGMETLQFAYFSRRQGGVIGLDVVDEMIATCRGNLHEAELQNPWFETPFVDLRKGDALNLPIADAAVDVAAQNCLFNIFHDRDLERALSEMYRVLKPHGRLILSDPVCDTFMPDHLRNDERLRALCLTGAIPLDDYIKRLTDIGFGTVEVRARRPYRVLKPRGRLILSDPVCDSYMPEYLRNDERLRALCLTGAIPLGDYIKRLTGAGFGTIEVRARRPYRVLSPRHYPTDRPIVVESIEICAIKDPVPADGPCVFTGRTAIFHGDADCFDDHKGHFLARNQPLAVCDKTAAALAALERDDIYLSNSTWFYDGGGCC